MHICTCASNPVYVVYTIYDFGLLPGTRMWLLETKYTELDATGLNQGSLLFTYILLQFWQAG